ncbi:MAG: hypothetical protein RSA66_08855 [Muribaculaceae bacterium]
MNIIKKFTAALRLREAVRQANKAHKEIGSRFYVMPNGNSGKLIIMDRFNFRKLKQKGYVSRNVFVKDLESECFYCTSYLNGKDILTQNVIKLKRIQYFSWIESISKTISVR